MQTVEAIVDGNGAIRIVNDVQLPRNRRALLTVLDEEPKKPEKSQKEKLVAAFKKAQKANLFTFRDWYLFCVDHNLQGC